MPERPVEEIADFGLRLAVYHLYGQASLPHWLAGSSVKGEPEPMAVLGIAGELTVYPSVRFQPGQSLRIEVHDFRVREHGRDEIEVGGRHLPKHETLGFKNNLHSWGPTPPFSRPPAGAPVAPLQRA